MFDSEALVPPPFEERLRGLLHQVCQDEGLAGAGVIEILAAQGQLLPAWRALVCDVSLPPPSLDAFKELVSPLQDDDSRSYVRQIEQIALGATALVLPLRVNPELSHHVDAALVLLGTPKSVVAKDLVECLETGLSVNRQERLTSIVYQAVHSSADSIELTDQKAQLFYVNPAWSRYFGYQRSEALGRTVGSLFRQEIAPLHDSAFYEFTLNTLTEGAPWLGALACKKKSGERTICEVNVSPFYADDEGFQGNFAIRRNIASRAEREVALASAHQQFREVLSAIPDGVVVLKNCKIAFANPALLKILGRLEEEVIGKALLSFIHPEDWPLLGPRLPDQLTGVRVRSAEGPLLYVELSTAGEVSFEGAPAQVLVCRDTTDQRLTQEQLSRSERLNALGSMAGGMAHEINNPLAYVSLSLRQLQREAVDMLTQTGQENLAEAIEGVERIGQIVADLQAYSSSNDSGPIEVVDIQQAATAAINIAQNELRQRAQLIRDFEGGLNVRAREGQLVQVFLNLLLNSAQSFVSDDSLTQQIQIKSRCLDTKEVEICFSDTGAGIASDLIAGVFDPFVTTKRSQGGSGLGLAISKRIIESFGGTIALDSSLGVGTSVTIRLPRAQAEQVIEPPPSIPPSAAFRPARVLIVDDEPALVRALSRVMRQHSVATAGNGREALELLQRLDQEEAQEFDVILCDLMMPDLSGSALYREVQERWPHLAERFIFVTGGAFTDASREFLQNCSQRVMQKPLKPEDLLKAIERVAFRHASALKQ